MQAGTAVVGVLPLQQTLVVQGYALVTSCQANPAKCQGVWNEETADAFDAWAAQRGLPPGPQVLSEGGLVTSAEVASVVRQTLAQVPPPAPEPPPSAYIPFVPRFLKRDDGGLRWGLLVGLGGATLLLVLAAGALRSR